MQKFSSSSRLPERPNRSIPSEVLSAQIRQPWFVLRMIVLCSTVGLIAGLIISPKASLELFWGIAVPLLPAIFMLMPGLWRNLCPLATSNQLPRLFGWSLNLELSTAARRLVYPIGVTLFFALVCARKLVFNVSGAATAGLIAAALLAAFTGGLWFKGKSGWCSSICPILPVQRIYGQAPMIKIENGHCKPCVGCAKNCLDVDPHKAHLSDQYDASRRYRNVRRFFAASFPGFVAAYFLVPAAGEIGLMMMLAQTFLFAAVSLTTFHLLDAAFSTLRNSLPIAFATLAFNIYYWFATVTLVQSLAGFGLPMTDDWVVVLRTALAIGSVGWLIRADAAERTFLRAQREQIKQGQIIAVPVMIETLLANRTSLTSPADSTSSEFRANAIEPICPATPKFEPALDDVTAAAVVSVDVARGQTVLEAMEERQLPINSGCRMGMCGADPVNIVDGAESLCSIGETEAGTLARLGCADGTRLACMARARNAGKVVMLAAESCVDGASARGVSMLEQRPGDPSIRTVLIVGNGVAGITAAEHVRRQHAECRIIVLAREVHSAYNRMAIARLLNDPQAMAGLRLHPDDWYVNNRIEVLLDSMLVGIDSNGRTAKLASGESIGWDRLIIASGAQGWVPPITDFDGPGAFMIREADDVNSLRAYLGSRKAARVLVIGAGLLGIEAAQALHKFGVKVSIISNTAGVLDRQADPIASSMLMRHLKTKGIEVLRSVQVSAIVRGSDRRVVAVTTLSGQRIEADAVLGCTGARPDLGLYIAAGLTTRGGIVVDERMQTNLEHVYAAGDVAECAGERPGLWASAISQGEVAALNATGGDSRYEATPPITTLKCAGIDVRSFGRIQRIDADEIELVDLQSASNRYRKLLISKGKIAGAILVNHPNESDRFARLVSSRADAAPMLAKVQTGSWVVVDANRSIRQAQAALQVQAASQVQAAFQGQASTQEGARMLTATSC